MKAASRKTLAAALSLGAAVFACPVQALQCLGPGDLQSSLPIEQAIEFLSKKVEQNAGNAQSIFIGHAVAVEHVPSSAPLNNDADSSLFTVTYKVSEWKKGSPKPYAKILHGVWCDGACDARFIIKSWIEGTQNEIYLAAPIERDFAQAVLPSNPDTLDGFIPICGEWSIVQTLKTPYPPRWRPSFNKFLYQLAIAKELEKLPSEPP